jgi:hypothetical protein
VKLKLCPECGVPEVITGEHQWLDGGDIVQTRAQTSRMIFIETENFDPLFKGIELIIGAPIEQLVITAARRANRGYLNAFVPEMIREKILQKEMDYEPIDSAFRDLARLNGVGSYQPVDLRYEQDADDFNTVSISEPHCLMISIAAHVAAIELLTGVDHGYSCEQVSPDLYNITVFPSPHHGGLKERMWFEKHRHKPGAVELERCDTCKGPKALSAYKWFSDRGVIANTSNRRRMAIQGDAMLDPIFAELESELGDTIPRVVVESQRRFTRSGFYTVEDITNEGDFRTQLALRGLGYLKELEMRRKGMRMRIENVALPLIVLGLAQGFFEIGFGLEETVVDWEISKDGTLEAEVKPDTLAEALPAGLDLTSVGNGPEEDHERRDENAEHQQ